jgi:hypothetical protein
MRPGKDSISGARFFLYAGSGGAGGVDRGVGVAILGGEAAAKFLDDKLGAEEGGGDEVEQHPDCPDAHRHLVHRPGSCFVLKSGSSVGAGLERALSHPSGSGANPGGRG